MPATRIRPAAMLIPLACLSLVVYFVARARADSYITDAAIETQQTATNGLADPAGYQQVFTVDGSGIQSIPITTPAPNNQSYNLTPDTQATHWEYDSQRYISLAALRGDYPTGSYTLNISYAGGRTRSRCPSARRSPPPPRGSSSPITRPPPAACRPAPRCCSPGRW